MPSGSLEYGDFMETLLLDLKGAQDNTENPSTIDGGYYTSGGRYLYSDIDRYDAGATRAEKPEEGIKSTFGFGVEVFLVRYALGLV